jgi:hypothetical protein
LEHHATAPDGPAGRRRALGVAASLACHGGLLFVLFWRPAPPAPPPPAAPMIVELVADPRPDPTPPPPAPTPVAAASPAPSPAPPAERRSHVRTAPAKAEIYSVAAAEEGPAAGTDDALSEAQIAGAARAGSGSGGACDMAGRLQSALRRDPLVRAAVAGSAGRAIIVWNGDWVRHGGEDGKGLAAVREAIMWEVAFAPKACRAEPVHGLILLSMNGGPGAARLAVGQGEWRWSDLLGARR